MHDWVQQLLEGVPETVRQRVKVLSIDTAINASMNVHSQELWNFLLHAARAGQILAFLLGPPCKTWSAVRFEQMVVDGGLPRGPRPLRMVQSLWALAELSLRELKQLSVGNCLWLKGLWLAVAVAMHRGAVVLEHPAMPFEDHKPSIWRTAIVQMLLRRPNPIFFQTTVQQWRYGSPGIKPTTFLCANLDIRTPLDACVIDGLVKPTAHLIGVNASGEFKTAAAKEYPSALNKAFAMAFIAKLSYIPQSGTTASGMNDPFSQYGAHLAHLGACAEHGSWLPDYQPDVA